MRLHRRRLSVRTKPCQSTPCIIEPPPGAVSSNKPVKRLDRMNTSRGKLLTQISGNSIKFPQGVAPSGQQSLWPLSALTLILLYFKTLPTVYTTLYMVQEDHKVWGHEEVLLVFSTWLPSHILHHGKSWTHVLWVETPGSSTLSICSFPLGTHCCFRLLDLLGCPISSPLLGLSLTLQTFL